MNIFTISYFRYPKHIENTFENYTFYYENDNVYKTFFLNNVVESLPYNTFETITNKYIKKICFAFYVLYFTGGFYIDLNVIPCDQLLSYNLNPNTFYCVKSIVDDKNLFLGIFGSEKNNEFNLHLIHSLIKLDKSNLNITTENIYEIIKELDNGNGNIVYFKEQKTDSKYVSTLSDDNRILFNHYYNPSYSYLLPYDNNINVNNISTIKIGITLSLFNDVKSFFSNGINQNALFLCELFINIGFDVYFIVEDTKLFEIKEDILSDILYDKRFKLSKYSEVLYNEFNVIITLSFSYGETFILNYLKHMNTKHVGYFCGNTYIIETEKILYNQHKKRQDDNYDFLVNGQSKYDEIWSIPQMSDINLHFWQILHRCKCIEVPFVWSSNAIMLFCKANKCVEEDLYYKNRGLEKKIAIFEPNISIMKWALPSVLLCENEYRKNKKIKHLYITNINSSSTNDFNLKQFNKLLNSLDIVKEKKCSIESRYTTLEFMSKFADVVVSHQWGNPLNYLYFDLAWMGWPIIHNAHLCKDIGYYYENFNLIEGSSLLNYVIDSHDKDVKNYIDKNRCYIDKYLPTNKLLQIKYKELILNLFSKNI